METGLITVWARPSGYWNSTGVQKPKGVVLEIVYSGGQWACNPWWGPCDGRGDSRYLGGPTYLMPGAPQGALIGKVGGDSQGGGSSVFLVGNMCLIPAELEGEVWLTVNDDPVGFGDNGGHLSVSFAFH